MIFDIIRTIFEASIPLSYICDEQVLDKTLSILLEIPRELNFTLQNLLINGHWIIVIKRVNSSYHFVSENS